jgi:hypothetical protein
MIVVVLLELGAGIAWGVDKPKMVSSVAKEYQVAVQLYDFTLTTVDASDRIVAVPNQK